MLKLFTFFIVLSSFTLIDREKLSDDIPGADTISKYNYIDQYKDIAIAEMYRTGIPASITLAQGLLESQAGKSDLAIYANNHFGIKCKNYWQGATYYHKDDDYHKGKLVESCFRHYDSVLESYVDHSNFLKQTDHYSKLFTYSKEDFASWAWGLKEAGYATDQSYPIKLIRLIQKFKLYEYDKAENPWNHVLNY